MKANVLQEDFYTTLTTVSRFVANKATLPILSNILLKTDKTKLRICATNLEMSIMVSIGAKIEEEGEIAIPARTLVDVVANLKGGPLSLESSKEQLVLSSSSAESVLTGINTADFPAIPNEIPADAIKLPLKEAIAAISSVLFSVSTEEVRPVLTGVLFMSNAAGVRIVSSDGFRLSIKDTSLRGVSFEKNIIVPKSVLAEIARLGKDETSVLELSLNGPSNQIVFGLSGAVISSRIIDGTFPDFNKIMPTSTNLKVAVDKLELMRCVRLASVFARDVSNVVSFHFDNASIVVSSQSGKSGTQKAVVDAKVDGDVQSVNEISYNFRFLEDFLGAIKGDEVAMEFVDKEKPGLFKDTSDPSFVHIIMPVRVQN